MKKKNLPALGLALALLLVFVLAAAIDYRALNSSQFTTSGTVSIVSAATMTNIVIRGSSSILNGRMNVSSTSLLITEYPYFTNSAQNRLDIRSSGDDSVMAYIDASGFHGGGLGFTNMAVSTLTYGATTTPDLAIANLTTWTPRSIKLHCTLTASITAFGAPTGTAVNGDELTIVLRENGTGGFTIPYNNSDGWNSIYVFPDYIPGVAMVSTAANKRTVLKFIYDSTDTKWWLVSVNGAY